VARLPKLIALTGSTLQDLSGIGPALAARLLGDIGDATRYCQPQPFRIGGTARAPLDVVLRRSPPSPASRAGNRRINRALHIMAVVQIRHDTRGRAYYRHKLAAGKTPMEALRCLKRRLSDVVYRRMLADAKKASPEGNRGDSNIQRGRLNPDRRLFG
jgi:hypothetical protein